MNWRRAFAIFALMAGTLPTVSDIDGYVSRLRAQAAVSEDSQVTKDKFVKVSRTTFIYDLFSHVL